MQRCEKKIYMTNKNENWERLESVIRWANMTINYFGRYIGLSRSENLYQIKAGKNGISQNLARRIADKFPEISVGWLLTGEGEMLVSAVSSGQIPFFDVDVQGRSLLRLEELEPECGMVIPVIEDCDCAMRCYDTAMSGEIMPGTIVFLKKIAVEAIIPGGTYVIGSQNYILLRKVHPAAEAGERVLTLKAANAGYDSVRIAVDDVECVYRVMAQLRLC